MATALLLCVGMVVIPLVALGAGVGAAARGAAPLGLRSRAARSPRLDRFALSAPAATAAPPTSELPVSDFTFPLGAAASAPAAAASHADSAALEAPRPTTTVSPIIPTTVSPVLATAITKHVVVHPVVAAAPVPHAAPVHVAPAPAAPARSQHGVASWYWAPPGTCAHPTLPFGTVLTIVDLTTGRTATCKVDDRGPYIDGRVVDLSPDVFARLEPLGAGIALVSFTW